jgi:photosystem I P700 chlorophyll a apoprotein A2
MFGTSDGAGSAILTFLGGFHPQTESLWLTDMAHHHLAIAVIFIIAGHMYRTNFGIGHDMKTIMNAHNPPKVLPLVAWIGEGHKGMYDTYNNSLHFQLGWHLACLGCGDIAGGAAHVLAAALCLHREGLHHPWRRFTPITSTLLDS